MRPRAIEQKVDIAHEALFSGWPTLKEWIGQYREHEVLRRKLDGRAADWSANARSSQQLLNRVELGQFDEWRKKDAGKASAVGHSSDLDALVAASRRQLRRALIFRIATTAALVLLILLAIFIWSDGRQRAAATEVAAQREIVVAKEAGLATAQAGERAAVDAQATAEANRNQAVAARQTAEANRLQALRNESGAWAELASQNLQTDPVASLWWSSRALPSPAQPRPAVPSAEYQLRLALQESLEQTYADLHGPRVDANGPVIAVGGSA